MLSPLRNRFGIPGVISVIALVFAMLGGAYAASENGGSGDASASAKAKKGPPGKRGKPGPPGPAGPAGPAGSAGAKGDTGAKGDKGDTGNTGAAGTNGKTVLSGTPTPTVAVGALGDFYIETDVNKIYGPKAASGANGGWGAGTDLKGPEGPEGSPWTAGGTLPPGETETGAWSITNSTMGSMDSTGAVSFPIPLEEPGNEGSAFGFNQAETENEEFTANCPGSLAEPQAEPGFLCVYTQFEALSHGFGGFVEARNFEGDFGAYGTTGAILHGAFLEGSLEEEKVAKVESYGTWAVTAPLAGP